MPIFDEKRNVLGTFAMYYRQPGLPQPHHWRLIDIATHIAAIAIHHDWTEAALRESEARYHQLFTASPDATFVLDRAGRLLDCNEAAENRYGYRRAELLQMTARDLAAPALKDQAAPQLQRALEAGGTFEWRHRRKDGTELPVEISAKPFGLGGQTCILSSVRDITERKQAEAETERQRAALQLILDAAPALIFHKDRQLRIVQANRELCRVIGLPPEQILGRTTAEFGSPYAAQYERDDREILATGQPKLGLIEPLQTTTGTRWLLTNKVPVRDAAGNVTGIIGCCVDITERKQAEEALREAHDRLAKIVATAPGVVCSFRLRPDGSACFPYGGERVAELYGITAGRLAEDAAAIFPLIHLDDVGGMRETIAESARRLSPWRYEWRVRHPVRGELWLEGHSMPVREPDGSTLWHGVVTDITARKQAEAALRASEERLRAIFDTEPECVKLLAADGALLEMNPAGLRMIEADSFRQVEHLCVYPLVVEEHRPAFRQLTEKVFLGESGVLEFEIVGLKGGRRWLETHASPLRDAAGKITALLGITRDITERRRAETALAASEHKYRRLTENLRQLVYRADPQTLVATFVNQAVETLYGYTVDEWLADPALWERTIHPQDRDRVLRNFQEAQQRKEDGAIEYRIVRKDGAERSVVDEFRWERDENDEIKALNGVMSDITERKRTEAALRESEERLRLAREAARMGTFDWDVPANRITWSHWHEELWGYAPGEFAGTYDGFARRVHPDDLAGLNAEVARCRASREPYTREFRVVWPDGSVHWIAGRGEFTFDAANQAVRMRGVVTEITKRKQTEAALLAVSGRLLQMQEEERRRIARDLHDTTAQNLAALTMHLSALKEALTPRQGTAAARALHDCFSLADQCAQEIRTFSYLLHPPLLEELGLGRALRDYAAGFARRSGVQVEVDLAPDVVSLPREIEVALFRVVQEGLGNVHRHSGSRTAAIRLWTEERELWLEVADAGRGIPADKLKALGTPGAPIGVGIAGMRERLEQLGGRLEVRSSARGTTLRAIVPLPRAGQQAG
jgi:PAS domain S-box-containing protein